MFAALAYISGLSTLIPVIYGLSIRFRVRPFFYRFLLLLAVSLLTEVIAFWLRDQNMSNTMIYNLYSLLYLPLFLFAWVAVRNRNRAIYIVELFCIGAGTLLIIYWNLSGQYATFNNMTIVVRGMVMIMISLTYLMDLAFYSDVQLLHREPLFFVMVGILIYYATTVSLFTSFNYLPTDLIEQLWKVKLWALIAFNLLVASAYYLEQRNFHD